MPGFLLHVGATVLCAHGGQAQPTTSGYQPANNAATPRRDIDTTNQRPTPEATQPVPANQNPPTAAPRTNTDAQQNPGGTPNDPARSPSSNEAPSERPRPQR